MENNDKSNNEEPILKICKICHRTLDINQFHLTKYGNHADMCLDCRNKRREEARQKRLDEILTKGLSRFSDKELIKELNNRGYKIEMKLFIEKVIREEQVTNLE